MTTFPGSPRLLKGAIVGLDSVNTLASVIVFQYNPDTVTRRLDARASGGGDNSDRSEAFRLTGPPTETVTLSVEVDAADRFLSVKGVGASECSLPGDQPSCRKVDIFKFIMEGASVTHP